MRRYLDIEFKERKGGTDNNLLPLACVLYLREGAGGSGTLFPLWTEIDGCKGGDPK